MTRSARWILIVLAALAIPVSACSSAVSAETHVKPAIVQKFDGQPSRITLSSHAAERLAVRTSAVRAEATPGSTRTIVPFAAILYDASGQAWAYTSPESLVYVRQPLTVARIQGNEAFLTAGPAVGSSVVVQGVAELYGAESGVGGGH